MDTLVAFQLAKEFKGMEGQQLRARELTFEPGAVVAIHQHDSRPGFAYILEGEIVEHRSDQKEPLVRRVGDVAVEWTGISHWWENQSGKQVRALVVDILDPDH
ncbi:MAG: cupin domain-containing protein [Planctomycetaceae bacterium]|nr:cupin domain-containing protein [Planctomycetaceae bacterium]